MQCSYIFASIAQFIDIDDFKTIYSLGTTCKSAKKVCDIILSKYLSDLIYVEHDNEGAWKLYQVNDLIKPNENLSLSHPWPIIGVTHRYGLSAIACWDTPCGFIMKRKDIIQSNNYYDYECSCEKCTIEHTDFFHNI
jgi:hypothetical protein